MTGNLGRKLSCLIGGAVSLIDRKRTMKSKKTITFLVALATIGFLAFLGPMRASADTHYWDDYAATYYSGYPTSKEWDFPSGQYSGYPGEGWNWNNAYYPTNGDTAVLDPQYRSAGVANIVANYNSVNASSIVLGELRIQGYAGYTATLNLQSQTLGPQRLSISTPAVSSTRPAGP